MIKFKPRKVDKRGNNTPIVSNMEIDEYAHAVLADYRPKLLRSPGKVSYQHFLESYMGKEIEFYDIYTKDPDRPILGMTAFEKGRIRVFDEDEETVKRVLVKENTVILNSLLLEPGKEGVALFTGIHEGGHSLMHWDVYAGGEVCPVVCCRRENIENFNAAKKERTAADWREHHADYYAAAFTMPNATFLPFINALLREQGFFKGAIKLGMDEDLDILANDILPEIITETYGVSKRAARIKLRQTGFVLPQRAMNRGA